MNEPTKKELQQMILDLFGAALLYQKGHDGRTEPFDCNCKACQQVEEIVRKIHENIRS